nr:hypothetical protein [Pseudonocardia ammonioxydans]
MWLVVVLLGVAAALVVVVVAAFPPVAATTCPRCFGMSEVAPGIHTTAAAGPEQVRDLTDLVAQARQRVADFYGDQQSSPTVVACFDDACYERIGGGGERGVAVLNRAVMLSPRGIDAGILAHEMSHVELHTRLGGARSEVPQWFDEGLAVVAGDDRRYIAAPGSADRCLVRPDGPLPASLDEWLEAADADVDVYAEAACEVSRWLAGHESPRAATTQLVAGLRSGEDFADLVR